MIIIFEERDGSEVERLDDIPNERDWVAGFNRGARSNADGWRTLAIHSLPNVGDRIRIKSEINHGPGEGTVPVGALGTVVAADLTMIRLKMDEIHPGFEEWNNEVFFGTGGRPDLEGIFWFQCETEPVNDL